MPDVYLWDTCCRDKGGEVMELGKDGKRKGSQHPRVLRRTDPVPERSTPAAKPKHKDEKPYGYSYSERPGSWFAKLFGIRNHVKWFKTKRQRDQSMADAIRKDGLEGRGSWYGNFRKEQRSAPQEAPKG